MANVQLPVLTGSEGDAKRSRRMRVMIACLKVWESCVLAYKVMGFCVVLVTNPEKSREVLRLPFAT